MTALALDRDALLAAGGPALLRQMIRIRRFEEKCVELYSATKIRGFLHLCIGEEAVAVGVISSLLPGDAVISTYREHGHALARGVNTEIVVEVAHRTSILPLVLAGVGHAVMPSSWAPTAQKAGLRTLLIEPVSYLHVAILSRKEDLTPAARAFLAVAALHAAKGKPDAADT